MPSQKYLQIVLVLLLPFIWLSGCGQIPIKSDQATPTPSVSATKKVALVLGGGGARGFAHVGVIRELESEKIPIDIIVGVSVGSLIGALYADSKDAFQLEWKAFEIDKSEIFDFNLLNLNSGLAKGEAIKIYIDKNLTAKNLEDLKIPLAVVATDIRNGSQVVFQTGPIKDAVRASTSIPGVFVPCVQGDRVYVDGGVLGNLAPQVARSLGADIVIAVNIAKTPNGLGKNTPNALNVVLESIELMEAEIIRLNLDKIDVLISPEVGNSGMMDFSRKRQMIEAGRQAAQKAMPKIKQLLNLP